MTGPPDGLKPCRVRVYTEPTCWLLSAGPVLFPMTKHMWLVVYFGPMGAMFSSMCQVETRGFRLQKVMTCHSCVNIALSILISLGPPNMAHSKNGRLSGEGDSARTFALGNVLPVNRTFLKDVLMDLLWFLWIYDSEDDFLWFGDDLDENVASGGDGDRPGIDRWKDGNLHPIFHAFTRTQHCIQQLNLLSFGIYILVQHLKQHKYICRPSTTHLCLCSFSAACTNQPGRRK